MTDPIETIIAWEDMRKAATAHDFYIWVEDHKIKLRAGIMKIRQDQEPEWVFDSPDTLWAWLQGAIWQEEYAARLGFDQKAAENSVREQRDRDRILRVLSAD